MNDDNGFSLSKLWNKYAYFQIKAIYISDVQMRKLKYSVINSFYNKQIQYQSVSKWNITNTVTSLYLEY